MSLIGPELLEATRSWLSTNRSGFAQRGISVEIEHSPPGRNPKSIRLVLETKARLGEFIVWTNGMVELSLAEIVTGSVMPEHRRIASRAELEAALMAVSEWVM